MPFDGTEFEPTPPAPERPVPRDTLLCVVVFLMALALLLAPITLSGLVDLLTMLSRR